MLRRTLSRLGVIAAIATVAVAVAAGPASAHVSVNPSEAAKGGFTKLTFRVPNEKDTASTVKLEVAFPAEQPLAFVSVKPQPGWKVDIQKGKLAKPIKSDDGEVTEAVSRIVWSAETPAAAIQPGQFQEFDVSVGPLPEDADSLTFKTLQTYSDGEVVRWIDAPTGSEEPEHPAPVLTLTKGADSHGGHADNGDGSAAGDPGDNGGPSGVAIGGLIAGLAGLVLGAVALARTMRTRRS